MADAERPRSKHADPQRHWLSVNEVGSIWGMRLVAAMCVVFGRRIARTALWPIALYYTLTRASARRASRSYLSRMGLRHGLLDVFRHVLRFAQCTLDRIFMLKGRTDLFKVDKTGHEHIVEVQQAPRGALLLGAHLGSFEALLSLGRSVQVVGYFDNAAIINDLFRQLDPAVPMRLIEVKPGDAAFPLRIKDAIEQGDLVGILGDRTMPRSRRVQAKFLGGLADFPVGPYVLAAALGCPVYLVCALHFPPDRYHLYCEPFAERVVVPREQREVALQTYVQQYAQRLEHYCRLAPDNWFNFYDFWNDEDGDTKPV